MTSTNPTPSIVMTGLAVSSPLVPEHFRGGLREKLDGAIHDCHAHGDYLEHCELEPSKMDRWEAKLKERQWQRVVIGNGVRVNMELTHFLERLIFLAHRHAPNAPVMFNTGPTDTLDAIRRWFPNTRQRASITRSVGELRKRRWDYEQPGHRQLQRAAAHCEYNSQQSCVGGMYALR